jgi:hypothetical protein
VPLARTRKKRLALHQQSVCLDDGWRSERSAAVVHKSRSPGVFVSGGRAPRVVADFAAVGDGGTAGRGSRRLCGWDACPSKTFEKKGMRDGGLSKKKKHTPKTGEFAARLAAIRCAAKAQSASRQP